MNKRALWSDAFQSADVLYQRTARYVFENASPYLDNAKVVIDKRGSDRFRKELARYLRASLNTIPGGRPRIKKIKPAVSERNNLVQLAEMVCGSIYRSMLLGKSDRLRYRGIIDGKALEAVRVWP
jgi:hypothetical protein